MKTFLNSLILFAIVVLPNSGRSYIPDTEWLMDQVAQRRAKISIHDLKVELLCGLEAEQQEERLFLKTPRKIRWEHADGSVEICSNRKCGLKTATEISKLPNWHYLKNFFFVEEKLTGNGYLRLLKALGVDESVNTLARFGTRVAVVLGAKEWERDRAQFWLDKEQRVPLRLIVQVGQDLIDIAWLDWGSRVSGEWYPGRLEIRKNGNLVESCSTVYVDRRSPISDELFSFD